eukprot:2558318-Amphidinium_carterae.1
MSARAALCAPHELGRGIPEFLASAARISSNLPFAPTRWRFCSRRTVVADAGALPSSTSCGRA